MVALTFPGAAIGSGAAEALAAPGLDLDLVEEEGGAAEAGVAVAAPGLDLDLVEEAGGPVGVASVAALDLDLVDIVKKNSKKAKF